MDAEWQQTSAVATAWCDILDASCAAHVQIDVDIGRFFAFFGDKTVE
jgi:hypothetical protein